MTERLVIHRAVSAHGTANTAGGGGFVHQQVETETSDGTITEDIVSLCVRDPGEITTVSILRLELWT